MKNIVAILLIACIGSLTNCNSHTVRVSLTPTISVKLPVNYIMTKQVHDKKIGHYMKL